MKKEDLSNVYKIESYSIQSYSNQYCPILFNTGQYCSILSNPVQYCPILFNPVQYCPILSNPVVLFYSIRFNIVLFYQSNPLLSCSIKSDSLLSSSIQYCPVQYCPFNLQIILTCISFCSNKRILTYWIWSNLVDTVRSACHKNLEKNVVYATVLLFVWQQCYDNNLSNW